MIKLLSTYAFKFNLRRYILLAETMKYLYLIFSDGQGLTLVHFSAQLEQCLPQENTIHTLNTP